MTPESKNVLITGASSGLGRGLATWFAGKGLKVYAAGRRLEQLESLKAQAGDHIVPVQLDVSQGDETVERIAALDKECGGLDLVVANAGVGDVTHGKKIDWRRVKQILDVNVTGAAGTLCAALPGMVSRGRGHLVAVSSLASFLPVPRMAAYNASKSFLTSFAEGLRFDVERLGLFVTVIHPGYIKSEMTAKNTFKMPFLLETDDAVNRMGLAIMANARELNFPWQMSAIIRSAAALPKILQHFAVRRVL